MIKLTVLSLVVCTVYQPTLASSSRNNSNDVVHEDESIRVRRPSLSLESSDILNSIPTGSVISFAGTTAPQGWLLCDGQQYSNQKYPQLYRVIGERYIPQESWIHQANKHAQLEKFFCVPDMRGRTTVGTDNGASRVTANNTLGASGGAENHQLTIDEMPSHSHGIQNMPGTHLGGNYPKDIVVPEVIPNTTILHKTNNSGGNQPHSIMQPYLVLNYIIKTSQEESDNQLNRTAQRDVELDNQRSEIAQLKKKLETMDQLEQKLSALEMGSAKAWVVFNGIDATVLDSYNIASVARNGIGKYTVNFIKSFNSSNYCFSVNASGGACGVSSTPSNLGSTKTNFKLFSLDGNGNYHDAFFISARFYGNQ